MRSFRIAAVAGISALALTFGSTGVALAEDANTDTAAEAQTTEIKQGDHTVPVEPYTPKTEADEDAKGSMSSRIGAIEGLEADKPAQGPAIFGSSKDLGSQPVWAQVFYAATILGGIGALIGNVIGPVYNFFVHGPGAR